MRKKGRAAENDETQQQQIASDITDLQSEIHEIRTEPKEILERLLTTRRHLHGLPLTMGDDCRIDHDSATTLNRVSNTVGRKISRFDRFGSRDVEQDDIWRNSMIKSNIDDALRLDNREQSLTTLNQILQIDHPRLRWELIGVLSEEETPAGIKMLVDRAKYDFVPEIRDSAAKALSKYSPDRFRDQLLAGLKYPWHVVAQHSAEALVRVDDQDAVPELVEMLKLPDPRLPVKVDENKYVQRQLVSVNHMRNCLLCHAPSRDRSDLGRGQVPKRNKPLSSNYYQGNRLGAFIRSDITYLRQDFSALQPVEDNGPWPKEQRFDYLIRNQKLNKRLATKEIKSISQGPNLNREAIIFALRELTGQQPADNSYEAWLAILEKRKDNAKRDQKAKLDDD